MTGFFPTDFTRFFILIIFLIFSSVKVNSQVLTGDWMYVLEKGETYTRHVGFSFSTDSLWELGNDGTMSYGKYQVKNDILSFGNPQGEVVSYKFDLRGDSLFLQSASGAINRYYSRRLEYDPNLSFDKIIFERVLSNDKEDRIILTLNKNGEAEFKKNNDRKTTKKKFKIEISRIQEIDSAFKWSFIEHIDTTVDYGSESEKPCWITIEYNDGKTSTMKGTLFNLPFRIKAVVWYLLIEMRKRGLA